MASLDLPQYLERNTGDTNTGSQRDTQTLVKTMSARGIQGGPGTTILKVWLGYMISCTVKAVLTPLVATAVSPS